MKRFASGRWGTRCLFGFERSRIDDSCFLYVGGPYAIRWGEGKVRHNSCPALGSLAKKVGRAVPSAPHHQNAAPGALGTARPTSPHPFGGRATTSLRIRVSGQKARLF